MDERDRWVALRVWGPYACFSRPEASVERLSYEIMTPGAARNILRAVYWEPEIDWEVREIRVLSPISWASMARNEVAHKGPSRVTGGGGLPNPYLADDTGARTGETQRRVQRSGTILREVDYVIRASIAVEPHARRGAGNDPLRKARAIFEKRVEIGRCHHQPYLGMREHHAFFARATGDEEAIDLTMPLGPMRYDVVYERDENGPVRVKEHRFRGRGERPERVKATPKTLFFDSRLERGVMRVPPRRMVFRAGGVRNPVGTTIERL